MTIEQAIGKVLRERRLALGWKLKRVADRAGVTISHLSGVELGKASSSVALLWNVSRVLGSSISRVLRGAEALMDVDVDVDVVSWERELEV